MSGVGVLFVGVVADKTVVTAGMFQEVNNGGVWSCKHVDAGYKLPYCGQCGTPVAIKEMRLKRVLRPEFTRLRDDHYTYGDHCNIFFLANGGYAAITTGEVAQCPGSIGLPNASQTEELNGLLDLLGIDDDVEIHHVTAGPEILATGIL